MPDDELLMVAVPRRAENTTPSRGSGTSWTTSTCSGARAGRARGVSTLCGATIERRFALERCDFVKLDVEGYDGVALASLAWLIERQRPRLVFEHRAATWDPRGPSVESTLSWLAGLDYALFAIERDVTRPLPDDPPPSCEILGVPRPREAAVAARTAAVRMSAG